MMRFVNIHTQLRQTAELFESLIVHQRGIVPSIIFRIVTTINSGQQRTVAAKQYLSRSGFLTFFLDDDFLCIGNNNVEVRIINRVQNGSAFIQKVKLDIRIQHTCIFRRNDLRLVKDHNLTQGLQNRFVRRKHQSIVAKTLIFRIFFCEQKLIEDTGAHQDGFTQTHGQSIDIVRVTFPVLFHLLKQDIGLLFCQCIAKTKLTVGIIGRF